MAVLRVRDEGPQLVDLLRWRPSTPPIGELCHRYGDRALLDRTEDGWSSYALGARQEWVRRGRPHRTSRGA